MQEKLIDCRGLACPAPVLRVKEVIEQERPFRIAVRVDNIGARENVSRFLKRQGFRIDVKEDDEGFTIVEATFEGAAVEQEPIACKSDTPLAERVLILIGTDCIGKGDDKLGRKLMANFIGTLNEMIPHIWRIVLLNAGVCLATEDSPVLDPLRHLESEGVSILVCGTCLDFYGLLDKKRVGETTNMLDIVTSMQLAGKVITIT